VRGSRSDRRPKTYGSRSVPKTTARARQSWTGLATGPGPWILQPRSRPTPNSCARRRCAAPGGVRQDAASLRAARPCRAEVPPPRR
jgi:hypothetical protein